MLIDSKSPAQPSIEGIGLPADGFRLWRCCLWRSVLRAIFLPFLLLASLGCQSTSDGSAARTRAGELAMARQLVGTHQLTKAVAFLTGMIKSRPDDAEVHYLLGLSLLGLYDVKAARLRFRKAVTLDPDLEDARLSLSYTEIVLKNFADAENQLQHILSRGKYAFMEKVHVNLGLNDMEQNRCARALDHFERALELDPMMVSAYFNKGKCLAKVGKLADAAQAFEKATDFCPGCGEPQIELAKTRFRIGKYEEALDALGKLATESPDEPTRKRALLLRKRMEQMRR
jgi:Flp pilus assembly protein TadD